MSDKKKNLTILIIRSAKPDPSKQTFLWDAKVDNLGVKIEPSGFKAYVFHRRFQGEYKRKAIASVNAIELDEARNIATRYNAMLSNGIDPLAKPPVKTVYEICEDYYERRKRGEGQKRKISKSSVRDWRIYIHAHIKCKPLGKLDVSKVSLRDATQFMDNLKKTPVYANRLRSFLKLVFDYAILQGHREMGTNVWGYVEKFRESPVQVRFAGDNEVDAFMDYLSAAASGEIKDGRGNNINTYWIALMWLLYLTGARPAEILSLQWGQVDFDNPVVYIAESKTGSKELYLSESARELIKTIPRIPGCRFIIPIRNYRKNWDLMRKRIREKFPEFKATVYSLRRYFATTGKDALADMTVLAKIIGHKNVKMTEYYAGENEEARAKKNNVISLANEKLGKKLLRKHHVSIGVRND